MRTWTFFLITGLLHAAAAGEQGLTILGQRVAVRRREADAGDDNPLMIVGDGHDCRSGFSLTKFELVRLKPDLRVN